MSNQLGNHKNVLGSSSQGWSIILVPALPGLPIHPFLAETLCLTIALSYKKKKKKPLSWPNVLHRPIFLMSALLLLVPHGKGCAYVYLHLFPPVICLLCVRGSLLSLFLPVCSHQVFPPSLCGAFPKSCLCSPTGKLEGKDGKGSGRQSFLHVSPISPP